MVSQVILFREFLITCSLYKDNLSLFFMTSLASVCEFQTNNLQSEIMKLKCVKKSDKELYYKGKKLCSSP